MAKDNAVHKDLTAHTFKEVMTKMYTTVYHMGKRWTNSVVVEFGAEIELLEMCAPNTEI